ncbi:flagellar hook-associated protein 1 FlgK [Paraburkholderia bannensis]|uniref:Flagellar hook-associated protein 1 n=1 Tax=Paraburkholderia bannensis TaxID=765414 RepID=A0A7W9WR12_9BURK|nr:MULTISPECIES: flagellar hook-associated protein FlgK [Paraburkholderia]MBB3255826.1 flagellar hook-associated protein 1 FlgK [Paraburkholderia sp. WP4_3_2]MBB6100826.1 flagellar hook-associated protein 1 FlgK [Paraburkholderia bannensis]
MSNIFSIGLSGLQAAQIGIATAGENISNSSTAGYNVESAVYSEANGQATGSGYIGAGVNTATVQRAYSQYITTALNNAQSTNGSLTASYTLATQLSNLVGSPTSGIASSITSFFTGLQNVSNSPSSSSVRQTALSDAQTLADQINSAGQQYDSLRQSVNTQLTNAVSQINTYSQQIAQLNTQIATASASGQQPNQLLDQRDQAVSNLSQLVGVQVVQNSSGYSVFLGNGQPLVVSGQNYNLTTQASDTNPSELTVAWQGLPGSTTAPQALSSAALTGGTVGGLVSFVQNTLDPAESQLGAIATSFASQVNSQNALGLTLSGTAGGNLFTVGAPVVTGNRNNTGSATVAATLTNAVSPPTDNYTLSYSSTAGGTWTLTDSTTNSVVGTTTTQPSTANPFTAAGLSITSTGTMANGDSYAIQPTAGALDSFSVATSDPSAIAAASPVLVSAATGNAGTAVVTQGTVTSGYAVSSTPIKLTYTAASSGSGGTLSGFPANSTISVTVPGASSPTTYTTDALGNVSSPVSYTPSSGATFTITSATSGNTNNVSFSMTGTPATGDTFTIGKNTSGSQDGRNALALANLTSGTSFTNSQTLTNAYSNYVNAIGNTASQLKASSTSQTSLVTQLTSQQQSVQGVNLDEEAAKLLQYQQLYQANSKVIQTAASLFQTLIGIFQ